MIMRQQQPTVSIRLMTYNHEQYVREAMEGIFKQKTNFEVEVVGGDDFSTDNTLNAIKEYKDTGRIKIRVLDRVKGDDYWNNRQKYGRLYNFVNIIENCRGKYISLLDGDDYWTDPLKLQKQVDFLEENDEYKLCFHRSHLLKENVKEVFKIPDDQNAFKISDLIDKNNFIATCSVVFRKPDNFQIPDWFSSLPFADLALYYLVVKEGDMYCLPEFMSVYRIHVNGLWSGFDERGNLNKHIRFLNKMMPYLSPDLKTVAIEKRKSYVKQMAKLKYPDSKLMRKTFVLINSWNK